MFAQQLWSGCHIPYRGEELHCAGGSCIVLVCCCCCEPTQAVCIHSTMGTLIELHAFWMSVHGSDLSGAPEPMPLHLHLQAQCPPTRWAGCQYAGSRDYLTFMVCKDSTDCGRLHYGCSLAAFVCLGLARHHGVPAFQLSLFVPCSVNACYQR